MAQHNYFCNNGPGGAARRRTGFRAVGYQEKLVGENMRGLRTQNGRTKVVPRWLGQPRATDANIHGIPRLPRLGIGLWAGAGSEHSTKAAVFTGGFPSAGRSAS